MTEILLKKRNLLSKSDMFYVNENVFVFQLLVINSYLSQSWIVYPVKKH